MGRAVVGAVSGEHALGQEPVGQGQGGWHSEIRCCSGASKNSVDLDSRFFDLTFMIEQLLFICPTQLICLHGIAARISAWESEKKGPNFRCECCSCSIGWKY